MFCRAQTVFNTTTFLLNSWAGLFKVVYPRLYGMSWRHFTVSMNPEFLAKFTLGGNVAIVILIKWLYGESTLCTSPPLHFKLNAIHGHATRHHSPSPLTLKIEKRRCQIARFTGGPCMYQTTRSHIPKRGIFTVEAVEISNRAGLYWNSSTVVTAWNFKSWQYKTTVALQYTTASQTKIKQISRFSFFLPWGHVMWNQPLKNHNGTSRHTVPIYVTTVDL